MGPLGVTSAGGARPTTLRAVPGADQRPGVVDPARSAAQWKEVRREWERDLCRERVVSIIGAAYRPFTEVDLRAQPCIEVQTANLLLGAD